MLLIALEQTRLRDRTERIGNQSGNRQSQSVQSQSSIRNVLFHPSRMLLSRVVPAAYDPRVEQHLCTCGAPLLARYDLDAARAWTRESLAGRGAEYVAVSRADAALRRRRAADARRRLDAAAPRATRLGEELGLARASSSRTSRSIRPTPSRRAASPPRSRAARISAPRTSRFPSAGNAANAMAAYAALAGIAAQGVHAEGRQGPVHPRVRAVWRDVTLVDGLITDAARIAAEKGKPLGWYDVSTLKEPYRIEGKKTMAYELGEQLDWQLPDWIIYPTGGGTGMVGMWKAFEEMERSAGRRRARPEDGVGAGRDTARRSSGPSSRARSAPRCGRTRAPWPTASACRRRSAISWSCAPCAKAAAPRSPSDADMVRGMRELGEKEGISAAPEGGAALHALACSYADGRVKPRHRRRLQHRRRVEVSSTS